MLTVDVPSQLKCPECGEIFENAVEFSTCPNMHGKLRRKLTPREAKLAKRLKESVKIAAELEFYPVAQMCSKRPKRYVFGHASKQYKLSSKPPTIDKLVDGYKCGRIIAKFDESPIGFAFFKEAE